MGHNRGEGGGPAAWAPGAMTSSPKTTKIAGNLLTMALSFKKLLPKELKKLSLNGRNRIPQGGGRIWRRFYNPF
jgi:hypothetical protein